MTCPSRQTLLGPYPLPVALASMLRSLLTANTYDSLPEGFFWKHTLPACGGPEQPRAPTRGKGSADKYGRSLIVGWGQPQGRVLHCLPRSPGDSDPPSCQQGQPPFPPLPSFPFLLSSRRSRGVQDGCKFLVTLLAGHRVPSPTRHVCKDTLESRPPPPMDRTLFGTGLVADAIKLR